MQLMISEHNVQVTHMLPPLRLTHTHTHTHTNVLPVCPCSIITLTDVLRVVSGHALPQVCVCVCVCVCVGMVFV
jgi:hypothetical protein